MKKNYRALGLTALLALVTPLLVGAQAASTEAASPEATSLEASTHDAMSNAPRVALMTNHGRIVVELFPDEAPKTVANFLSYVNDGFYDGTVFHRVIRGFMVQGGGFTTAMEKKDTKAPVKNEADNGLKNERGTLAMARTGQPDSATAQFFINTVANSSLDHRAKDMRGWGYAVFAKVVEGMDVVDAIEGVKTSVNGRMRDVPVDAVIIESARVLETTN